MADGRIIIDTHINNKQAEKQLQELEHKVGDTAKSVSKIGRAFSNFGSALKIGGLGAGVLFAKVFELSSRLVGVLGKGTGTLSRFGGRMKEILSGALLFNGISKAVSAVTEDFGTALSQCDAFRQGMANLKGAAAVATAPLVQALAPALGAVANAAAMALHYVAQLVAFFTGGSVKGFAAAAKSMNAFAGGAAKAKRSLAGFDQINKLGDSSGGGGGSLGEILPNFDFSGSSPFLETVKAAIQNGDWAGVGSIFAAKLRSIVDSFDAAAWGSRIGQKFQDGLAFLYNFLLGDPTLYNDLGTKLAQFFNNAIAEVDAGMLGRLLVGKWTLAIRFLGNLAAEADWKLVAKKLSEGFVGALNSLTEALASVDWGAIGEGIVQFLTGLDWAGIAKAFANCFIAAVNSVISLIVGAINSVFDLLNTISFDIPSYVPGFGGAHIGFSLAHISAPQIPYLAQGAVIPPNREFLAVLGDQTHGTNVEAPLETIQQALANVLAQYGPGDITITFTGDLAQLGRVLKPVIDKEGKRRGAPLVKGVSMT